jgi:HD superfamily phosphodiesterase
MVSDPIITAEQEWLGRTLAYCRNCFPGGVLPSHDEQHHLRTWRYARQLIPLARRHLFPLIGEEITALLLACLLHDTGMRETLSPAHGAASRRLAARFFDTQPQAPPLREEILTAIEKHDEKEYREKITPDTPAGRILTLLTVADDLDALGYTGIYRYYEIYSLRGILLTETALRVKDNLEKRFGHMQPLLEHDPSLLQYHRRRYRITRSFFEDLAGRKKGEALAVIRFLEKTKGREHAAIGELIRSDLSGTKDNYLKNFLAGWLGEIKHNLL